MRKEEGKVREGMTDEEREMKMGKREKKTDTMVGEMVNVS